MPGMGVAWIPKARACGQDAFDTGALTVEDTGETTD